MVICSYNDHLRLLSPEPFGWFAPPKLTRVWEPTLLWNQLNTRPFDPIRRPARAGQPHPGKLWTENRCSLRSSPQPSGSFRSAQWGGQFSLRIGPSAAPIDQIARWWPCSGQPVENFYRDFCYYAGAAVSSRPHGSVRVLMWTRETLLQQTRRVPVQPRLPALWTWH